MKNKKQPDKEALQITQRFAGLVKNQGVPIQKVLLFGSRAKGNWHPWSDVDICVVSPQFGKNTSEEMDLLLRLTVQLKSRLPVEPIPFAPNDLNDKFSSLANEIRQHGISVETK